MLGTLDPTTGNDHGDRPDERRNDARAAGRPRVRPGREKLDGLGADDNFYSVNTTTGALTLIGHTGITFGGGWSIGNTSDGTIYADGAGVVYTINPTTGGPTTVGDLPFTTSADINGDDSGKLYIINNSNHGLYSVSRTTGVGTLIGVLPTPTAASSEWRSPTGPCTRCRKVAQGSTP